jgi:low affinity Fe/Cu permease
VVLFFKVLKVKNQNVKPKEGSEKKKQSKFSKFFNTFSEGATKVTGGVLAFIIAIAIVIIWAVTGPIFKFSDTWQLVMNTTSSIITFLMVFVIQHTENKDMTALQVKLDALIEKSEVSDKMINIEELSDEQLEEIKSFYNTKKEKEKQSQNTDATAGTEEMR